MGRGHRHGSDQPDRRANHDQTGLFKWILLFRRPWEALWHRRPHRQLTKILLVMVRLSLI
jgi:hypothetical protein